jgi:hypothetical protein
VPRAETDSRAAGDRLLGVDECAPGGAGERIESGAAANGSDGGRQVAEYQAAGSSTVVRRQAAGRLAKRPQRKR